MSMYLVYLSIEYSDMDYNNKEKPNFTSLYNIVIVTLCTMSSFDYCWHY